MVRLRKENRVLREAGSAVMSPRLVALLGVP
jgi:hypothetical protein